jgi:hypothetical protein
VETCGTTICGPVIRGAAIAGAGLGEYGPGGVLWGTGAEKRGAQKRGAGAATRGAGVEKPWAAAAPPGSRLRCAAAEDTSAAEISRTISTPTLFGRMIATHGPPKPMRGSLNLAYTVSNEHANFQPNIWP